MADNPTTSRQDALEAINEEIGEYCRAVRIEEGRKHGVAAEPSKIEAIDIILVGMELFILSNGSLSELEYWLDAKLSKYEEQVRRRNGTS